jgi:hypothetical protein
LPSHLQNPKLKILELSYLNISIQPESSKENSAVLILEIMSLAVWLVLRALKGTFPDSMVKRITPKNKG